MRYLLACVFCFGVCFAQQDEVVVVEEPTTPPTEVVDADTGSN